jgi:hypothetical protein
MMNREGSDGAEGRMIERMERMRMKKTRSRKKGV